MSSYFDTYKDDFILLVYFKIRHNNIFSYKEYNQPSDIKKISVVSTEIKDLF